MHQVIDSQTGNVVRTFKTRKSARSFADRKDLEYGAIRYSVRQKCSYAVTLGVQLVLATETKNFPTLAEAREFCNQHHARTGVVLAITEVRQ